MQPAVSYVNTAWQAVCVALPNLRRGTSYKLTDYTMPQWVNTGMDEQQSRLQTEMKALIPVVARLTALPSNWNGEITLVPGADFKGKKRFSCGIELDANLARTDMRWSTLLHEALHSFSVGYVATSYWEFPGWEEGVVEQLQRRLRPLALAELDIAVDGDVFLAGERTHRYNTYITQVAT